MCNCKSPDHYPLEDRAMKAAAKFMGDELLPLLGVKIPIQRIAPTEQVFLELRDFSEDFNYELSDGSWLHLEFESDAITKEDMIRFRVYEAMISYHYHVPAITYVICSSGVKKTKNYIKLGINTYRVRLIRLKDKNADQLIHKMENRQKAGKKLKRKELLSLLLTPLMDGKISQIERISRSIQMIQNEKKHLEKEELMQMQGVLYLLAMKFLSGEELNKVKEKVRMTILGQMIWQDGLEEGREEGANKVNRLIQCLAQKNRMDEILKAAEDKEYQQKLFKEFNL